MRETKSAFHGFFILFYDRGAEEGQSTTKVIKVPVKIPKTPTQVLSKVWTLHAERFKNTMHGAVRKCKAGTNMYGKRKGWHHYYFFCTAKEATQGGKKSPLLAAPWGILGWKLTHRRSKKINTEILDETRQMKEGKGGKPHQKRKMGHRLTREYSSENWNTESKNNNPEILNVTTQRKGRKRGKQQRKRRMGHRLTREYSSENWNSEGVKRTLQKF